MDNKDELISIQRKLITEQDEMIKILEGQIDIVNQMNDNLKEQIVVYKRLDIFDKEKKEKENG